MRKKQLNILRIIISFVLFVLSFLLPDSFKLYGFILSYLCVAYDILIKAVKNVIRLNPLDENFLMAIASVGAFIIGEYSEGAAVMIFYQVGEAFQDHAVNKSRRSIKDLMDIQPDYANIEKDKKILRILPEEVAKGDIIVINPGEKIPLDGVVESGETSVDTSAITGESLPRNVFPGNSVISGCVNLESVIRVRVTEEYENSTAAKILETVEGCAAKKAKSEKFIAKFAKYYTPIVVIGAVLVALIPPFFGADLISSIKKALIFLVVSCPCALVISVPLTFFGAIGGASRRGILIKGSEYIDKLSKIKVIAFDKTGTLTQGAFTIQEICAKGMRSDELLFLAAHAELFNDHPIATSLKSHYEKELSSEIVGASTISHGGVTTEVNSHKIYVGNSRFMQREGISINEVSHSNGATVYVARDKEYIGYFIISDVVKPTSQKAIQALKKQGVERILMLTGDAKSAADKIARELGISEVHSQLLPQQKADITKAVSKKNAIAFVGDGINDAPVLAISDVGISMGLSGSGAAIEASDVVLMQDDPQKVCEAIALCRKAMRIVTQNIVFALGVKIAVLLFTLIGYSSMWAAVFADVGVAVIVIINAMRMLIKKDINNQ